MKIKLFYSFIVDLREIVESETRFHACFQKCQKMKSGSALIQYFNGLNNS